jgi:putative transposase
MPSPHTIKTFTEDAYYHVYNRGVEKRRIFEDAQDYQKFLHYLSVYLTEPDILHKNYPLMRLHLINNNLSKEVGLLSFCLMPNHFHLLLHQKTKDGITKLMKQVSTAYSMYFNKRYERVGTLFQGVYKAVMVTTDEQLLHLSRYIHLNPIDRGVSLHDFQWSSYKNYIKNEGPSWVKTSPILDFFNNQNPNFSYENFVEKSIETIPDINNLTLDSLD